MINEKKAKILSGSLLLETAQEKARAIVSNPPLTPPHLAIILVGTHIPSQIYVEKKRQALEAVGFSCTVHHFTEETTEGILLEKIDTLNDHGQVHGILVQLPLPAHINRQKILDRVSATKDVDGLTSISAGLLYTQQASFVPGAALGAMNLIHMWRQNVRGLLALVVGQSTLVGKPLDMLLTHAGATVIMAHQDTKKLSRLSQQAQIIVSATGVPGLLSEHDISSDSCLIDVGIVRKNGRLVGDLDVNPYHTKAGALTPVPGGVGPATIAALLDNMRYAFHLQTQNTQAQAKCYS